MNKQFPQNADYHAAFKSAMSKWSVLGCVTSLILLTACGGSGAGDTAATNVPDDSARLAIEPLAGVWDLPDNWKGEDNDIAVLLIKSPDADGIAEAIIYDYDDAATGLGQECYRIDGTGNVNQSLTNALFMDDLSAFPDAEVSLNAAGDLVIVYSDGITTSTNRETITIIATSIGITETDITPLC